MTRAVTPDKSPFYFRSTLSHYSGGPLQQPISVGTALILQTWNALILCMDCYWKKQDDVPRSRWGRTLGPLYVSLRINHWHKELWQLLEGWINFVTFDIHGPCCVMSLFRLFRLSCLIEPLRYLTEHTNPMLAEICIQPEYSNPT